MASEILPTSSVLQDTNKNDNHTTNMTNGNVIDSDASNKSPQVQTFIVHHVHCIQTCKQSELNCVDYSVKQRNNDGSNKTNSNLSDRSTFVQRSPESLQGSCPQQSFKTNVTDASDSASRSALDISTKYMETYNEKEDPTASRLLLNSPTGQHVSTTQEFLDNSFYFSQKDQPKSKLPNPRHQQDNEIQTTFSPERHFKRPIIRYFDPKKWLQSTGRYEVNTNSQNNFVNMSSNRPTAKISPTQSPMNMALNYCRPIIDGQIHFTQDGNAFVNSQVHNDTSLPCTPDTRTKIAKSSLNLFPEPLVPSNVDKYLRAQFQQPETLVCTSPSSPLTTTTMRQSQQHAHFQAVRLGQNYSSNPGLRDFEHREKCQMRIINSKPCLRLATPNMTSPSRITTTKTALLHDSQFPPTRLQDINLASARYRRTGIPNPAMANPDNHIVTNQGVGACHCIDNTQLHPSQFMQSQRYNTPLDFRAHATSFTQSLTKTATANDKPMRKSDPVWNVNTIPFLNPIVTKPKTITNVQATFGKELHGKDVTGVLSSTNCGRAMTSTMSTNSLTNVATAIRQSPSASLQFSRSNSLSSNICHASQQNCTSNIAYQGHFVTITKPLTEECGTPPMSQISKSVNSLQCSHPQLIMGKGKQMVHQETMLLGDKTKTRNPSSSATTPNVLSRDNCNTQRRFVTNQSKVFNKETSCCMPLMDGRYVRDQSSALSTTSSNLSPPHSSKICTNAPEEVLPHAFGDKSHKRPFSVTDIFIQHPKFASCSVMQESVKTIGAPSQRNNQPFNHYIKGSQLPTNFEAKDVENHQPMNLSLSKESGKLGISLSSDIENSLVPQKVRAGDFHVTSRAPSEQNQPDGTDVPDMENTNISIVNNHPRTCAVLFSPLQDDTPGENADQFLNSDNLSQWNEASVNQKKSKIPRFRTRYRHILPKDATFLQDQHGKLTGSNNLQHSSSSTPSNMLLSKLPSVYKSKTILGTTDPSQDIALSETTAKYPEHDIMEGRIECGVTQNTVSSTCTRKSTQEPVLFECDRCGKQYKRGLPFIRHKNTHLPGHLQSVFKCLDCDRSFHSSGKLKQHKRSHHYQKQLDDKNTYVCQMCARKFTGKAMFRFHMQIHTEEYKPYECQSLTCKKRFDSVRQLHQHKRTHSTKRPHPCPQCNSRFKHSHDLLRHLRTHSGEKPHLCPHCGKCFAQTTSLMQHERTHTGERPYCCQVCGSSYTQSGTLRYHIASSHPEYVTQAEVTSTGIVRELLSMESSDDEQFD